MISVFSTVLSHFLARRIPHLMKPSSVESPGHQVNNKQPNLYLNLVHHQGIDFNTQGKIPSCLRPRQWRQKMLYLKRQSLGCERNQCFKNFKKCVTEMILSWGLCSIPLETSFLKPLMIWNNKRFHNAIHYWYLNEKKNCRGNSKWYAEEQNLPL